VAEIEASCSVPVLTLFAAAAAWLGVGALLAVIAAIKAHAPGFLAGAGWLTYGRVYPASNNALVYGFALQAGLGASLWMLCRLGRNLLQGPWMIVGATLFWNIGVLLGFCSILAGESTGYPWLEMAANASPVLFSGFALIAVWALITGHLRTRVSLYVSQWFILLGLLWFPWIYSTAQLLLVFFPGRGVMQAVVNGWYTHNFFELCLGSFGLAAIFYFLPKLLGRPLHSRGLALFGFWFIVLFGGWGGLHRSEPVPNWMSAVSEVGRVFLLVPVLAFALSWYRTLHTQPIPSDPILGFIRVSLISYAAAVLLAAAGALPEITRLTAFTLYHPALAQLRIHGFLSMALLGAGYYVIPRLVGAPWPSPGLITVHFWAALAGMILSVAGLLIGGLLQGAGINQPSVPFLDVVRHTVPFLGINTLGMTLLFVGYAAFVINFGRLLTVVCPCAALSDRVRALQAAPAASGRSPT
jgi:cytochrome c oxidase cbb3-type subunit 1